MATTTLPATNAGGVIDPPQSTITNTPNVDLNSNASVTGTGNTPQATASQVTSTPTWQNTPDQTVSGQINGIISQNSPLLQQAQTQAKQSAASSGLLNSSMATTAGESALYNAALPIASADANQASKVAQTNVQNQNSNAQFNTQQQNNVAGQDLSVAANSAQAAQQQGYTQQNLQTQQANNLQTLATQQGFDLTKMDAQARNTLQQMSVQQQNTIATLAAQEGNTLQNMSVQQVNDLAKLSAQISGQTSIANIEAQYKDITQGSQSATTLLSNAQNSINQIVQNTNMDATSKTAAIQDIQTNLQNSMQLIGALAGNVDLSQYVKQVI